MSQFLKSVFNDETAGCFIQKNIVEYEAKKMQEIIIKNENSQ